MKLASVELVKEIRPHPNADSLEIAVVLGYECIVPIGKFLPGRAVILIQPDTVLPDKHWAETFRKRSNRVKAMKLRGVWSFGIVLSALDVVDRDLHSSEQAKRWLIPSNIGKDISEEIGVTKYEPPAPKNLEAAGYLPPSMPKTDEERYQNLTDSLPYGELVDVTLKIDGQSATYFCIRDENAESGWRTGICSRSLEIKPDCNNNYTLPERKYNILEKLKNYCAYHNVSLALRGEVYGQGIQAFDANPHSKLPLDFAAFSVWNHDTLTYEGPNDPHYYERVAAPTVGGIPVVPMVERQVVLTPELIEKYARGIDKIDGKRFEGVVIKHSLGSFKVINLSYDERK
jgi:RNA ligase (TIGR02306 family)